MKKFNVFERNLKRSLLLLTLALNFSCMSVHSPEEVFLPPRPELEDVPVEGSPGREEILEKNFHRLLDWALMVFLLYGDDY